MADLMTLAADPAIRLALVTPGGDGRRAGKRQSRVHFDPVMLAPEFLLTIEMVLIAKGFGAHVAKRYNYAAPGFSGAVEGRNVRARRRKGSAA